MTCQLCLANWATRRITDNPLDKGCEDRHYCQSCYEAKYLKIGPPPGDFPRLRYTLKNAAVLIVLCALISAAAVLVVRSGHFVDSPPGVRKLHTFLAVSLTLGFYIACFRLFCWLGRVIFYKRTGGLVTAAQPRSLTRNEQGAMFRRDVACLAWIGVAFLLAVLVCTRMSPIRMPIGAVFVVLFCVPVAAVLVLRVSRDQTLRNRIRQDWGRGSWQEGMFRAWQRFCARPASWRQSGPAPHAGELRLGFRFLPSSRSKWSADLS